MGPNRSYLPDPKIAFCPVSAIIGVQRWSIGPSKGPGVPAAGHPKPTGGRRSGRSDEAERLLTSSPTKNYTRVATKARDKEIISTLLCYYARSDLIQLSQSLFELAADHIVAIDKEVEDLGDKVQFA